MKKVRGSLSFKHTNLFFISKLSPKISNMIPHCYKANVWVHNEKGNDSNLRWMKWKLSSNSSPKVDRIHVEPRIGMLGMVLDSESKSCFCRNICEFSIADQPLVHHQRRKRCNACFAICLQSSLTGELYVLEFFLNLATYEYLRSFLNFLLPIIKHELKTFKLASGKQVGEELVVEVIEFSEANQLTSYESDQLCVFPITFKSVHYGLKEHQFAENQQVQSNPEVRPRKQNNAAASNFKKTEKGKKKTGLRLSLEILKPHFGNKLEDVAEELGVGRSTIKRACREYGINRWPGNKKQARNPSLFERESAHDHQQDVQPSSSSSLQLRDTSLHDSMSHTHMEITQHMVVQEEAEKDEYMHRNKEGLFTSKSKTIDLLTQAHETSEHRCHVQPVGLDLHITPAYFNYPKEMKQGIKQDYQYNDDDGGIVEISDDSNTLQGPPKKKIQKTVAKERMVWSYTPLPAPLKIVYIHVEQVLNNGKGILIALDVDVFGNKCEIYIHLEDITPFCEMEPISGNCIVVYIWHLYNKMKEENTLRRFQFVTPFTISYVPNSQSNKRAYALADRFHYTSPSQLVLAPCNVGEHWILTIIEPYKEVVSLLDPLGHCIREPWKDVVNMAIRIFHEKLGKKGKEQPTWEVIKAPLQPDNKQCGYYVMRYMKEIVQGLKTIDSSSLSSLFVKEEYSQTEINEVRTEWVLCVQEHV